jgi:uncharacterized protein (TIGR02996 family)
MHVMTHEEAFIRAIREAPNDDAPRLIYADWLEEHGQADRAEFIRLQCGCSQMLVTRPERSTLKASAESLLRRNWQEWVAPLGQIVGPWRDRYGEGWMQEQYHPDGLEKFKRGFVESLSLNAVDFLRHVRELQRLTPLLMLRLWGAGFCSDALAAESTLSGLAVLEFTDYYDAPLTAHDMAVLAASPYLEGLSALLLGRNNLGDEGVEALARAPWLVSVRMLDLTDNGISERGIRALANSPYLVKLAVLCLRKNSLSRAAIAALRESPKLRRAAQWEHDPLPDGAPSEGSPHP